MPRGLTIRQSTPSVPPISPNVRPEQEGRDLRIVFENPGFFLADVQVVLLLDGTPVYEGGFRAGIDVAIPIAPGQRRLESVIELGLANVVVNGSLRCR